MKSSLSQDPGQRLFHVRVLVPPYTNLQDSVELFPCPLISKILRHYLTHTLIHIHTHTHTKCTYERTQERLERQRCSERARSRCRQGSFALLFRLTQSNHISHLQCKDFIVPTFCSTNTPPPPNHSSQHTPEQFAAAGKRSFTVLH